MKKNILFFSPHTAIWVHSLPEAKIAKILSKKFKISYVFCNTIFKNYCIAMSAFGLNQESEKIKKEDVCIKCIQNQNIIKKINNKINYTYIENWIDKENIYKIDNIIKTITFPDILEYEIDNIRIGMLSLYELTIQFKKNNFEFNEYEVYCAKINFYNTLISYHTAKNYFDKNKIDFLVLYNYLYSVNHVWKKIADQLSIPVYVLHAGENLYDRLNTIYISKDQNFRNEIKKVYYRVNKKISLDIESSNKIINHFDELFKGNHFYAYSSKSSGKSIYEYFELNPDKKTVLVTMSSYDERFSSNIVGHFKDSSNLLFKSQIEWVKELIKFFNDKDDYQLILRLHPREFPNKRDSQRSLHSLELEKLFSNLSSNIKANYPSDNFSLYEIAFQSDCILNAWSSAGEELALFGLPILIYDKDLIGYPEELNFYENNLDSYFKTLNEILSKDILYEEKLFKAMIWYTIKFNSSIKLFNNFQKNESSSFEIKKNIFFIRYLNYIRNLYLQKNSMIDNQYLNDINDFYDYKTSDEKINLIFLNNLTFSYEENHKKNSKNKNNHIKITLNGILNKLLLQDNLLSNSKTVNKLYKYLKEYD